MYMKIYCAAQRKEERIPGDLVESARIPLGTVMNNASLSRRIPKKVKKSS
jgi:hypothetical protein